MNNREWLNTLSDEEYVLQLRMLHHWEFRPVPYPSIKSFTEWLTLPHIEPITLTDDERVILRNLDKELIWLARDLNGSLFVYETKPSRSMHEWLTVCDNKRLPFPNLFQFVQWSDTEPVNIQTLL